MEGEVRQMQGDMRALVEADLDAQQVCNVCLQTHVPVYFGVNPHQLIAAARPQERSQQQASLSCWHGCLPACSLSFVQSIVLSPKVCPCQCTTFDYAK